MSIRMLESFDGGSLTGTNSRWQGSTGVITTASGRTNGGIEISNQDGYIWTYLPLISGWNGSDSAGGDDMYFGFAFRPTGSFVSQAGICGLWTGGGSTRCLNSIHMTSSGLLDHRRSTGAGSSVLGTSLTGMTLGNWHYIEWYIKRDSGASGRSVVKLDGVVVLDFTGDTYDNPGAVYFILGSASPGLNTFQTGVGYRYDDVYILEPDGVGANSFLGVSYVPLLRPNGNGASSQWVGSDANSTDNYLLVDEVARNDLDYVEAFADADRDVYEHETYSVPANHYIAGVQVGVWGAYLGAAKTLKTVARLSGGTSETKTTIKTLGSSLAAHWGVHEERPGGGTWTQSDLDDAQFGFEQGA